jgi:acyl carrier protein
MNADESRATVLALLMEIAPETDPDTLDPEVDLRREADLDSLDFLNLIEGVAQSTGVEIPETAYAQVRTLRGLSDYVLAHAAAT